MPDILEKFGTCVVDRMIYVIGGAEGGAEPGLTTNIVYNPDTDM